jgi:hypothetical protein
MFPKTKLVAKVTIGLQHIMKIMFLVCFIILTQKISFIHTIEKKAIKEEGILLDVLEILYKENIISLS